MADLIEALREAAQDVYTSSTNKRIKLFRQNIPSLLESSELSSEFAYLVEIIFQTLPIYDDRASRKAVDDLIVKFVAEANFMKNFAPTLVQYMERQMKTHSPLGCHKLLKWSCLLLQFSQFASMSKGGFSRLAIAQARICQILMHGPFRTRRACNRMLFQLFKQSPDIYKLYMEELKDGRLSIRHGPELVNSLLNYSIATSPLFDHYKSLFIDIYLKVVLNAKDKPSQAINESFLPLYMHIEHEDFKTLVFPACVKMLKRNPEIVLESICELLKSVKLDLSKYSIEFLSVVLPQARHADEDRRIKALDIIGCLSQMSSDPDTQPSMFLAIKNIIGG